LRKHKNSFSLISKNHLASLIENSRVTGAASFNLGSLERPCCHATTVTLTGNFARGGIQRNARPLPIGTNHCHFAALATEVKA
jgi:hypothetical protein